MQHRGGIPSALTVQQLSSVALSFSWEVSLTNSICSLLIVCQAAVAVGGGEEGFFGGEGGVIGAAGDDGLRTAQVFGMAVAIPFGAEVDEGPALHHVGEVGRHQGEVAVDGLEVVEG